MNNTVDLFPDLPKMRKGANLSANRLYRYSLYRIWDDSLPRVGFIMHNPSKADENDNDRTINRCIDFAKIWGYGGIHVGNLSPFRCTNPKELINDPRRGFSQTAQMFENEEIKGKCEKVILAYGVPFQLHMLRTVPTTSGYYYLRLTKSGYPEHPLYLPKILVPIPFD